MNPEQIERTALTSWIEAYGRDIGNKARWDRLHKRHRERHGLKIGWLGNPRIAIERLREFKEILNK